MKLCNFVMYWSLDRFLFKNIFAILNSAILGSTKLKLTFRYSNLQRVILIFFQFEAQIWLVH